MAAPVTAINKTIKMNGLIQFGFMICSFLLIYRFKGSGFRVQGSEFWVQGFLNLEPLKF
jgi:hypothetical protein